MFIADAVKDTALQYLKDNCVELVVLDADPGTSYADATTNNGTGSGKRLATKALSSTDFTIADGAAGGRKVTLDDAGTLLVDIAIVANGDASHVSWLSGSDVLYTTELATVRTGLTTADTVDIPSHFYAIRDAVEATGN